jgi:hypothetical protein
MSDPDPTILNTEPYSPAVMKRVWDNGSEDYICSWPGCEYIAETVTSIGAHYKSHSGSAARRRRGERPSVGGDFDEMVTLVFAAIDLLNTLVDKLAAMEADYASGKEAMERLNAMRKALE